MRSLHWTNSPSGPPLKAFSAILKPDSLVSRPKCTRIWRRGRKILNYNKCHSTILYKNTRLVWELSRNPLLAPFTQPFQGSFCAPFPCLAVCIKDTKAAWGVSLIHFWSASTGGMKATSEVSNSLCNVKEKSITKKQTLSQDEINSNVLKT